MGKVKKKYVKDKNELPADYHYKQDEAVITYVSDKDEKAERIISILELPNEATQ